MDGAGILLFDPKLSTIILYKDKAHNRHMVRKFKRDHQHLSTKIPILLEELGGKKLDNENLVECAIRETTEETNNYLKNKIHPKNLSQKYSIIHHNYQCFLTKVDGFNLALAKKYLEKRVREPGYDEMSDVFPIVLDAFDMVDSGIYNGYHHIVDKKGQEFLLYPRTYAIIQECFNKDLFNAITLDRRVPPIHLSMKKNSLRNKSVRFAADVNHHHQDHISISPSIISSRHQSDNNFFLLISASSVVTAALITFFVLRH